MKALAVAQRPWPALLGAPWHAEMLYAFQDNIGHWNIAVRDADGNIVAEATAPTLEVAQQRARLIAAVPTLLGLARCADMGLDTSELAERFRRLVQHAMEG